MEKAGMRQSGGDKGASSGIRGSPESQLPELRWRRPSVEAQKMKTPFGGRAPRRLPRLCSDSVSDSASEVHNTPLCTPQRRTLNLLPFGASTRACGSGHGTVSGRNYSSKIKPTNTEVIIFAVFDSESMHWRIFYYRILASFQSTWTRKMQFTEK